MFALVLGFNASHAFAITVDGQLNDWGVTPGPYGSSDWTPNAGVSYFEEDQNPGIYYLSPGYGGQDFDAEAIYFTRDNTFAYFAVVSGFPLDGRYYQGQQYDAGDFAIDFGSDGIYDFGVETRGADRGKVYSNPTWINPLFTSCGPYAMATGTLVGNSAFFYNNTTYLANGHYVFEFGIPISLFGSNWSAADYIPDFTAHWTMSCGNDCVNLTVEQVPNSPEPNTFALLALGLTAAAAFSFSRKRGIPAF